MSSAFEASGGAARLPFSRPTHRGGAAAPPPSAARSTARSPHFGSPASFSRNRTAGTVMPSAAPPLPMKSPGAGEGAGAGAGAPSLFQLVAVARCYRTLVSTWMWLPAQMLLGPVLFAAAARLLFPPESGAGGRHSRATTTTTTSSQVLGLVLLLFLCLRGTASALRQPRKTSSLSSPKRPTSEPSIMAPPLLFVGALVVVVVVAAAALVVRAFSSLVVAGGGGGGGARDAPPQEPTFVAALASAAVSAGRLSVAFALLGWAVLGRYLGPASYRRMSSGLLVMNPAGEVVWTLWNRPMAIFGPGDGHDGVLILGGLFSAMSAARKHVPSPPPRDASYYFAHGSSTTLTAGTRGPPNPTRYLYVTAATLAAQLVVAVAVGGMVTVLLRPVPDVPGLGAGQSVVQVRALLAGMSAVTVSLLGTVLDGCAPSSSPSGSSSSSSSSPPHELSPALCFATRERLEALNDALPRCLRRSVAVGALSAAISTVLTSSRFGSAFVGLTAPFPRREEDGGISSAAGATLGVGLLLTAYGAAIALYLLALDECMQIALFDRLHSLCSVPGELDDLIEELGTASLSAPSSSTAGARPGTRNMSRSDDDGAPSTPSLKLELVLTALLHSEALVREVVATRIPSGGFGGDDSEPGRVEREEKRLVVGAAGKLGNLLIDPSGILSHPEAPWEEDVLRAAMMRALASGCVTEEWFGGRQGQVQRAIGIDVRRRVDQFYPMFLLPLVRALCVHVRGMGDALLKCSGPTRSGALYGLGHGTSLQRWHIPPGFEFAAQSSLEALSNFLAQSLAEMSQVTGWKSSLISPFVPVGLSSMHCLRRGLLAFEVPPPMRVDGDEGEGALVAQHPTVSKLVQACDDSALRVVTSIQLPPGHPLASRNSLRLEEEVSLWVTSLLTAQVNKST